MRARRSHESRLAAIASLPSSSKHTRAYVLPPNARANAPNASGVSITERAVRSHSIVALGPDLNLARDKKAEPRRLRPREGAERALEDDHHAVPSGTVFVVVQLLPRMQPGKTRPAHLLRLTVSMLQPARSDVPRACDNPSEATSCLCATLRATDGQWRRKARRSGNMGSHH